MEQQREGDQPTRHRHRRPPVGRRRMLTWLAVGTVTALGGGAVLRQSLAGADEPAAGPVPGPGPGGGTPTGHQHGPGAPPPASGSPQPAAPPPPVDQSGRKWSDAKGWGGRVPGPGSAVRITDKVVLDADVQVGSLLVERTGSLVFAADKSLTLASAGNVEVRGTLALAPDGAHTHTLRFPGIDERRFAGGGMTVVDTDTGLWVTGQGYLRLDGAPRTAWTRAATALKPGDTTIKLAAAPAGWQVGDELAVTPTAPPDTDGFSTSYDLVTVERVDGATVTLTGPLENAHPRVALGGGATFGAEVLNLSRNVRVEGTEQGRAHVHLTSSRPADVRHAALRWLGPRADGKESWNGKPVTEPVLGRYGLHFHMLLDTSRGTVVEGVVVRDTGSHAFVPHASHGITFRGCISHDTWEDAYWWDGPIDTRTPQGPSNDIAYEGCVASRTVFEPNPRGYRLTGFSLGAGTGSSARDCVAVGVQGAAGASGYEWPETSEGVWTFERCLAHNNLENGVFVWLNAEHHHTVTQYAAYHNGGWGIEHGAYLNDFDYTASVLYGNAAGGIAVHALGRDRGTVFDGLLIDAAGQSDYAVATLKHQLDGEPVTLSRSRLTGYRKAGVAFRATADGEPDDVAVLDCEFGGPPGSELWLDPGAPEPERILFRPAGRSQTVSLGKGGGGQGAAGTPWNAVTAPAEAPTPPRAVALPALAFTDSAPKTGRVTAG
ncbi:G8 domain-containing protein [Kitasatospora phosalacinea]|uniref:G8 domain-containing protein n=1 Tax=Kitasatospora phosalacinea TaxID=2065 RepID=UPI0005248992|nr:G8 domain-containing protein [Kitasatospora phosalacinea]